jgi:hypothetical protein
MKYVARSISVLMVFVIFWIAQPGAYAQDSQTPFLDIVNVNMTQPPTIQLSVVGGNLAGELSTLPLKLFEADKEQTIIADRTALVGIQLALVIDPRNILAPGTSGQAHHAEVSGVALGLIENKVITRNVDLLAAYSLTADGALQTIQDWTKEPNLIFNSIVQNKPEEVGAGMLLTDLLLQVLDKLQTPEQPSQFARSLLLLSAGASQFDLAKVVAKASERHVYIHTVEMAAPNQPAGQASELQQLAQQTHGQYVFLESTQKLDGLWPVLAGLRTQRTLTYQATSTPPGPLRLQLTLPNNSMVEAKLNLAGQAIDNIKPAQVTTATVPANAALVATATVAPATVVDVATAAAAPVTDNVPVVDTNRSDGVAIPGTGLIVPRSVLQLALPVLILLLAYFVYRDLRERKARATQSTNLNRRLNSRDSQLYALSDPAGDLKPLSKNKPKASNYDLQMDEDLQVQAAEPMRASSYAPGTIEDDQNDEATIVPRPAFGDDEATYRRSEEIEQPIIGSFVRVAGNPTLANELPIYGLNPARGEVRQIHIGRHSKNNTVVINDKSISREHAVIVQKEGRLYLRDNASTAGTFLNGKRLQPGEELLLRHNDLVSFGEVIYEFHAKGEDEATVAGE